MSQNKVTVPTVSREEIYRFPDESFTDRMTEPIDVATLFLLGFSDLGRHLDDGDLLFDGA